MTATIPQLGPMAVAAVLSGLVYLNALDNPFVYDDRLTVVENPSIRDGLHLRRVLLHSVFRPVVNLSYAVDYTVWGLQPFGFHLTSVLLHMANVTLLFLVARCAVRDWADRSGNPGRRPDPGSPIAFTAAALFGVHPMMTEAVGYVSGRAEVLCGAFFLLAWLALRAGLVTGRWAWRGLGLGLWGLALLAKEVAIVLPLVLAAYDRVVLGGTSEARARRLWRWHLPLLGFALLVAGARVAAFVWVEPSARTVTAWQYGLMQAIVSWRYVELLVAPVSQSLVHPVREITSPLDVSAWLGVAALGIVIATAVRVRQRMGLVTFGLAWFLLLLVPSSSVIALLEPMAEHRVYLASFGFFLALAAAVAEGSARLVSRELLRRRVLAGLLVIVVSVLAGLTVARNRVWADPVTLWRDAAGKAPQTWVPHYALGDALRERGRCPEAIPAYERAVHLLPREPAAHTNLGICLAGVGRFGEAYDALTKAAGLRPGWADAQYNLGVAARLAGRAEVARQHFQQAIAGDPGSIRARERLAELFETTFDNPGEAARLCREIEALAPRSAAAADCVRRHEARLRGAS